MKLALLVILTLIPATAMACEMIVDAKTEVTRLDKEKKGFLVEADLKDTALPFEFTKMDANSDGKITVEEIDEATTKHYKFCNHLMDGTDN